SWSNDVVAKYQTAFDNKHTLLDVSLGWHHQDGGRFPADGSPLNNTTGLGGLEQVQWHRPSPAIRPITEFEDVPNGAVLCAEQGGLSPCPAPDVYYSGGPDTITDSRVDRYQANFVVTRLLRAAGHHVVKAGVDAEMTTYRLVNAYSGGRRLDEALDQNEDGTVNGTYWYTQRQWGFLAGPDDPVYQNAAEFDARGITVGGFLQDSWSILDVVTLNAGLRYDVQVLYNDNGDKAMVVPNQWSPRIGAIYDFTRNGRSKIYGSYARHYESVPLDIAQRALSGDASIQTYLEPACSPENPALDPACRADPGDGGQPIQWQPGLFMPSPSWAQTGGGRAPVDPDLKAQSSDEFVLGAEYEVLPSGRLGVSYTHRYINHIIEDLSNDEAGSFFIGNPGHGMASTFPKPRRDWDAISLYFEKNWKREWLAQASYTVSWLRGNYSGLYRPENLQLDPNMNSTYDIQSLVANADGPLPGDHRHQLKAFGAKEFRLPKGMAITTGLGYRGRSGAPTNYFGSHPVYSIKEVLILPRGSGERTPWVHSIDPHVGYSVDITKSSTFEVAVDVFNVFNFQAVTRVDENFTTENVLPIANGSTGDLAGCKDPTRGACNMTSSAGAPIDSSAVNSNFGNPIAYQEPLTVRFGARLTF
ncbi:MAG TPA: TonB-dependent receptor, partial [Polyangiaceae bacterium]